MFGVVVGDPLSDDIWSDIEGGGDSSGAGHVANDGLASEEASNSEGLTTKTEASFATFAIKFGIINPKISVGGCAISQGFVFATEFGKVGVVRVIAVQDDDFRIHFEEVGFGV